MNKKKKLLLLIFLMIFHCNIYGQNLIDLNKIKQIESSGNRLAYNKHSQARGFFQITPICLTEYNNFHKIKYTEQDLFNGEINETISRWYFEIRIPQMLRYFKLEVNIDNILWAYNGGINKVRKNIMDNETKNYIRKYKEK